MKAMKAYIVPITFLALFELSNVYAATPVFLIAETKGAASERLAFMIKEQVQASRSLTLASTQEDVLHVARLLALDMNDAWT